jgi:hypothetical protein
MNFVAALIGVLVLSQPLLASENGRAALERDLESIAAELSVVVADGQSRALLAAEIKQVSKSNVACLRDCLGTLVKKAPAERSEQLLSLMARVQQGESSLGKCGSAVQRLDVSVPVAAHRDLLNNSEKIYVVAAPLADDSEVKQVTAYANGERLLLSADEAPKMATLVVGAAETESLDPSYPPMVTDEEATEANQGRVVDDFVGIPRIWIDDDHEPWWKGDPEIYVRVIRFRFSPFGTINNRVNLPGVNDEQVWYNIGDPNGTYRFVSQDNFAPTIQFQVWEEDGPFDGDDHLGTRTVRWTNLPFGGYSSPLSSGDMRIRVDRD